MDKHVYSHFLKLAVSEQSNKFRANAFRKAAAVIKLKSFSNGEEALAQLKGHISDKMMDHVAQAIETYDGTSQVDVISDLMKVTCIGEAAAKKLQALGVNSVNDLKEKVRKCEDLGLTKAQLVCIKHNDAIQQRIPREELNCHNALLVKCAKQSKQHATVVGSYRRKAASSGDIDVLLVGDMKTFLNKLRSEEYIIDMIAEGSHKFMGMVRLKNGIARRLDILCTPIDVYPFAMLHFTGPMEFNVSLRKRAIKMGIKLSERGWTGIEGVDLPKVESENDILKRLGVRWTEPEHRNIVLQDFDVSLNSCL